MKVAVGIPCSEVGRYTSFYDSLLSVKGIEPNSFIFVRGGNVAANRETAAELATARGFDLIWYTDDDQAFGEDTLQQLLAHDKDIVSGLYVSRELPFMPFVFDHQSRTGEVGPHLLKAGDHGLIEAKAVGAGCLLVKLDVFKKLEKPWWRLGQYDKQSWGDDMDFCQRVRAAGFKIWCDLECTVGHTCNVTVWPQRQQDGTWRTAMTLGENIIASWAAASEE